MEDKTTKQIKQAWVHQAEVNWGILLNMQEVLQTFSFRV